MNRLEIKGGYHITGLASIPPLHIYIFNTMVERSPSIYRRWCARSVLKLSTLVDAINLMFTFLLPKAKGSLAL